MKGTTMKINADLSKRALARTSEMAWTASPAPGVERKMLDRDGAEVARATSMVRFAPGSSFPHHQHGAGEEYLVLEGTFSDQDGDYPAGTYVRHPPGSQHASSSAEGCVIFVKLRQMSDGGEPNLVVETGVDFAAGEWLERAAGVESLPLFTADSGGERVFLTRFAPGARFPHHDHPGGEEVLVLEGALEDEDGHYPTGTWLRCPPGSAHAPFSAAGCTLWVKVGHLA